MTKVKREEDLLSRESLEVLNFFFKNSSKKLVFSFLIFPSSTYTTLAFFTISASCTYITISQFILWLLLISLLLKLILYHFNAFSPYKIFLKLFFLFRSFSIQKNFLFIVSIIFLCNIPKQDIPYQEFYYFTKSPILIFGHPKSLIILVLGTSLIEPSSYIWLLN